MTDTPINHDFTEGNAGGTSGGNPGGDIGDDSPRFGQDRGELPLCAPGSPGAIRLIADGELPDDPAQNTDGGHEQIARAVRTERSLRAATGRVMGDVNSPAGLRERVLAAVHADQSSTAGTSNHEESGAEALTSLGGSDTRDASTWSSNGSSDRSSNGSSNQPNQSPGGSAGAGGTVRKRELPAWTGFAAAAAVMLVTTLYFMTMFSAGNLGVPSATSDPFGFNLAQATYVSERHQSACERSADIVAEFDWTDENAVMDEIAAFMGKELCVGRLPGTQDCPMPIDFQGAGACKLPGAERALHVLMRFEREGDPEEVTASLFISDAPGSPDVARGEAPAGEGSEETADASGGASSELGETDSLLKPGKTYRMDGALYGCENYDIIVWEESGIRYHLVTRVEARDLSETVLAGLYRPAPTQSF